MTTSPDTTPDPGGERLLAAFEAASAALTAAAAAIDAINVYPVPDGDTGSNMAATLREAGALAMAIGRTISLMAVIGLFTSVTSEAEIAHGVEDFLYPLARLGLPVHRLALVVSETFRFIPVVAMELESIVKAQASRGADFGTGRGGPLAKARAYLPLIVPVTIRALERAEVLSEAMEARCYTGRGRTRLVAYARQKGELLVDLSAFIAVAALFAADALLKGVL